MALGFHDDADLAQAAAAPDEPRGESPAGLEAEPLAQVHKLVQNPRGVEDGLGSPLGFLVKGDAQLHEQRPVVTGKRGAELRNRWKIGRAHEVLAVGVADRDLALETDPLIDDDVGDLDESGLRGALLLQGVDDLPEFLRWRFRGLLQVNSPWSSHLSKIGFSN